MAVITEGLITFDFFQKKITMRIATLLILLLWMHGSIFSQNTQRVATDYFQQQPHLSIRALQVCSEQTVWFAANNGVYGFTRDGGKTWHTDSIAVEGKYPEFRSIAALNDSTVLLLSIDSPAYMFKTYDYGKNWRTVYTNHAPKIFFDALYFKDAQHGIAVSDPADGCFRIMMTYNGGETWQQIPCKTLPAAYDGEACFAASNSTVWWQGNHLRFVTGGKHSRLFVSDDGASFTALPAPVVSGEELTGIFTTDFANAQTGYIGGGNYLKNDSSIVTLFKTTDGGHHWTALPLPGNAFVSSVKILSGTNLTAVTGMQGTYAIDNKGKAVEWLDENGSSLPFYALSYAPGSHYLWMAGSKGRIARLKLNWQK